MNEHNYTQNENIWLDSESNLDPCNSRQELFHWATLAAHHYPKSIYMQVPIITAAIHVGLGNTKSTLPPCQMVVYDGYLHLVIWS